jgi:hypothetical protein
VVIALFLCCFPEDPPLPEGLSKPQLAFVGFTVVSNGNDGYTEAIHLHWTIAKNDENPVHSFTLLRKLPDDSVVDVFSGSRLIPPDTGDFFDELVNYTFPQNGFDSLVYRIFAVDASGRSGDTSKICIVFVVPQPFLILMNPATSCCSWESWIRGGVFSWCRIWRKGEAVDWTSKQYLEFPLTDKPAAFSACFPDSLQPMDGGRWYYALFVKAGESYSLKTGVTDVP